MDIQPILFEIPFPIKIFKKRKINLNDKKQRELLFKRNIYYNLYGDKENNILEKRWRIFVDLATSVKKYLINKNKSINILSISVFGSALHYMKNDDYDFLVIIKGNKFDNIQTKIAPKNKEYSVGISIKGEENFTKGILDNKSPFNQELQRKIVNRTSISLPYRHLPILGYDFKENKEIFLKNCYAQAYDLLINSYKTYYLKGFENKIPLKKRSRKILSRIFEASKYLLIIKQYDEIEKMQTKIILNRKRGNLKEDKKLFREFVYVYNKIVKSI